MHYLPLCIKNAHSVQTTESTKRILTKGNTDFHSENHTDNPSIHWPENHSKIFGLTFPISSNFPLLQFITKVIPSQAAHGQQTSTENY